MRKDVYFTSKMERDASLWRYNIVGLLIIGILCWVSVLVAADPRFNARRCH
jgi:hypothetical protein